MYRRGTKNYYYVAGDGSCWHGLRDFLDQVVQVVDQAAQAGYPLPGKTEEWI